MPSHDERPFPHISEAEFFALIRKTPRVSDCFLLNVLRTYDPSPDNWMGARPSIKRLVAHTGLSYGYIRNRLSALRRAGAIQVVRGARLSRYYIVAPAETTKLETPKKPAAPKPSPRPPKAGQPWVAVYAGTWADVMGGRLDERRVLDELAEPRKTHGDDALLPAWKRYLREMTEPGRGGFASPKHFASRVGQYLEKSQGLRDAYLKPADLT